MSRVNPVIRILFVLAFALLSWGCSSTANDGAAKFEPIAGAHPSNWTANHYAEFIKNPAQCQTCHGSTSDKAKAGGTSGVSCFKCHVNGPSHQPGFEAGLQHGRLAAQGVPGNTSGFAYCTKCHGSHYDNPIGIGAPSCTKCHTKAPHPNKPWNGPTAATSNHTFTQNGNAAECAKCHTAGANSTLKPSYTPPAGTAPGCFNNTLCHATTPVS